MAEQESTAKVIQVALGLCIVCSVVVSGAAIGLKKRQEANALLDKRKNILTAAGLMDPNKDYDRQAVAKMFERVESKVIDFESGKETEAVTPGEFEQLRAAQDPSRNVEIPKKLDPSGLNTRAKYGYVHLLYETGERQNLSAVILPMRAKGLWSTMLGFLALDSRDLATVKGFAFYSHGETPGLGGEVDNPRWKNQWIGKVIYEENWTPVARVIKGAVPENDPEKEHKVDGLSGATITSNGVTAMVEYWFSQHAYGTYLKNLYQKLHGAQLSALREGVR